MELQIDGDLQSVAEFMQKNIPAAKLLSVAEDLPKIGRLLWARYPQEPSLGLMLSELTLTNGLQPNANECAPGMHCAGDGSVAGACAL